MARYASSACDFFAPMVTSEPSPERINKSPSSSNRIEDIVVAGDYRSMPAKLLSTFGGASRTLRAGGVEDERGGRDGVGGRRAARIDPATELEPIARPPHGHASVGRGRSDHRAASRRRGIRFPRPAAR